MKQANSGTRKARAPWCPKWCLQVNITFDPQHFRSNFKKASNLVGLILQLRLSFGQQKSVGISLSCAAFDNFEYTKRDRKSVVNRTK